MRIVQSGAIGPWAPIRKDIMTDHVYKTIELVGSSATGIEDAVQRALTRVAKTVRRMRWFQVTETRGTIENDQIGHWQVCLRVGFTLEE